MYKSQYDYDVTVWSPQGRLHQLEYACLAVDQGSVVLGLKSNTHAVLVGLRRTPHKVLAYHTEKLFTIDDHMGIGVSGLISDGRRLCKYMINETLNYKYVYNKPMPTRRLIIKIADKQQVQTQQSSGRPYGVGLLVIGYDSSGPHLYETDPSGQYFEYLAHAIGARNQAAKTYLEKQYENFPKASLKELVQHGVRALKETVRTKDLALNVDNVSVMVVGKGTKLYHLDEDELQPYIDNVEDNNNDDGDDDDDDDDSDDNNNNKKSTDNKTETQGNDKSEPMQVDE